jgi:ATP adenylyltransferase
MAERLWAPWRFDYVSQADPKKTDGCIFVELPKQSDDRANLILYRGEHAFVMLNAFPYASGHLMVAPYKHTADLDDLSDEELLDIQKLIRRCMRWIKGAYNPQGFNVGANIGEAGGAGIPSHLHWHIVPRWSGDTSFMTSVAEVRVIPQSLESAFDKLMEQVKADVSD